MKRKGKVSPLMVVATKTPKAVESYQLARFESDEGVYITNANLETHTSPFTGEVVSASNGKKVTASLKEDNCIGIQCSCSAINAMDTKQVIAHGISSINCVVCSSKLEFDLDSIIAEYDDSDIEDMDDDEESMYDMNDEESEYDMDDEESEFDMDDDEESMYDMNDDEEESEDYIGGDDVSDDDEEESNYKKLTLSEMVSDEENITFASIAENRYGAFAGDVMIATLDDVENKFNHIETQAFADGFNQVVEREGLKAALESASFNPVKVSVKATLANIARREQARIETSAEELAAKKVATLKRCLDIAAAGGTVGMFKKDGMTILVDSMAETLANLGVKNPKKTAHKVISGATAQYNASLLNVALQLAKKDEVAIRAIKEQIESMSPEIISEEEIEEDTDEESKKSCSTIARLETPIKQTVVASIEPQKFRGLFVA